MILLIRLVLYKLSFQYNGSHAGNPPRKILTLQSGHSHSSDGIDPSSRPAHAQWTLSSVCIRVTCDTGGLPTIALSVSINFSRDRERTISQTISHYLHQSLHWSTGSTYHIPFDRITSLFRPNTVPPLSPITST